MGNWNMDMLEEERRGQQQSDLIFFTIIIIRKENYLPVLRFYY